MADIVPLGLKLPDDAVLEGTFFVGQLGFISHLVGCMSFIGGLMISFFGGVGLISVPYDLIYDYLFMPQPIDEKDFTRRRQIMLNYTLKLRDMGKSLENERTVVAQIKGFSGWRKRRAFAKKVRIYETRSLMAEREYTILDMEANYY